jgi:uncharacterized protein YgiM (DUF1202 family)
MIIVSIAIAVICIIICRNIYRKTAKPGGKIFLTILASIVLIVILLSVTPNSSGTTKNPPSNNQTSSTQRQVGYKLVNSDALNVRSGPSADHGVVGQVTKNMRVQILESSGQWWKIRYGSIEGYVNSNFLQ